MTHQVHVQVRRVYDTPEHDDGARVLVDRIWPRGLTKTRAELREWCKTVAPSTELRKWYSHYPARFVEFTHRYQVELAEPERSTRWRMAELAAEQRLTLLTATKQPEIMRRRCWPSCSGPAAPRLIRSVGPMSDQHSSAMSGLRYRGEPKGAMP